MLWRVDQGEATNIAGVPDPELKAALGEFLVLMRLRSNDKVKTPRTLASTAQPP